MFRCRDGEGKIDSEAHPSLGRLYTKTMLTKGTTPAIRTYETVKRKSHHGSIIWSRLSLGGCCNPQPDHVIQRPFVTIGIEAVWSWLSWLRQLC